MECHYCREHITAPYARYGDRTLCPFCSAQIEHQRMLTYGEYTLHIERRRKGYLLSNQIKTLKFKSLKHFEYWQRYYGHLFKSAVVFFQDSLGYLWRAKVKYDEVPCDVKVQRYWKKVSGCMWHINKPKARQFQKGDRVIFQLDGSNRTIPGTILKYSDKLRMYYVETSKRKILAPEKYLTRDDVANFFHFADAEVLVNGSLSWRGCTFRRRGRALRMAARYDPRLRGLAQRLEKPRLNKEYHWDGMIILIRAVDKPRDFLEVVSEVNVSGTPIRID